MNAYFPEKPLRLLIVGVLWPLETFLDRLIRGLVQAGLEITVASPTRPDKDWLSHPRLSWLPAPSWNGSVLFRLGQLGKMSIQRLAGDFKGMWRLAGLARSANGEVPSKSQYLHFLYKLLPFVGGNWDAIYFPWNSSAIEYLPLIDLIGCPAVVSCRGSQVNIAPHDPHREAIIEGLKLTFQRATAVHCVSEAIKTEARQYGLAPEKAVVIRPAVDPEFFCPGMAVKINKDAFKIVTVGSLIWNKGYEYALQAIRGLLDRGFLVDFHIVGDGPERQRLLYTIQDLDLEKHAYFHGHLSPVRVLHQLQQADAFLLSSLSEGISNALLEAMACGLPVVTTDCGGMREAVNEGVQGFMVPVRDPEAMANALEVLIIHPELLLRMKRAARQHILNHFCLDTQVSEFIALFKKISDYQ
jgi:colanic acid/amylovoran biosynthesis glycosyltransferase